MSSITLTSVPTDDLTLEQAQSMSVLELHGLASALFEVVQADGSVRLELSGTASSQLDLVAPGSAIVLDILPLVKGDKGDVPSHIWSGTALVFQNPDGTMGEAVDLKGAKGDTGGITDINGYLITQPEAQTDFTEA